MRFEIGFKTFNRHALYHDPRDVFVTGGVGALAFAFKLTNGRSTGVTQACDCHDIISPRVKICVHTLERIGLRP